jgi:hypothetical protein
MAQGRQSSQQSSIQSSSPKRQAHISYRWKTQNHSSTPRNHQEGNTFANHAASGTDQRRVSETTEVNSGAVDGV